MLPDKGLTHEPGPKRGPGAPRGERHAAGRAGDQNMPIQVQYV